MNFWSAVIGVAGLFALVSLAVLVCRHRDEHRKRLGGAVLQAVLESPAGIVIFALDREYRYLAFNENHRQTMKDIWGVEIEVGRSMLEYIDRRDDRAKAKENFDRALSGEHFSIVEAYGNEAYERRYYEDVYSPIVSEQGDVVGLTLYLTDITKQRQVQEELDAHRQFLEQRVAERTRELEDRSHDLERSNRDLEQFANVASHELKSPLRRISSFAELLAEEYEGLLSDEADDYINHMVDGVHSLGEVIESLLTYSRVQTDRTSMEWVDVGEILDEAVRNLAGLIHDSGAVVSKGTLPDQVAGDRTLLRQLLENLVGNAIKFNTTGRTPEVLVTCRRDLLEWEFAVADNGPGLDPAYRDKVFTMFQRLHLNVDGTGIGLALCKKIVGIHRGKIWYEPAPGGGTVFKFTLSPRKPDEITQG